MKTCSRATPSDNPDLKPESSKGVETGIRGHFDSGSFDIAVFYNKYRNFIDEDASVAGGTAQQFEANNIKHATIKGIEAKGRLNLDAFGAPKACTPRVRLATPTVATTTMASR